MPFQRFFRSPTATGVEARQGYLDRPVLAVLLVSLTLVLVAFGLILLAFF